jgi:hypothetical protein
MRRIALTLLLAIITPGCHQKASPIVGLWMGEMNGLPAVELVVRGAESQITGEVTFFFQRMDSGTWKVERQRSQPLDKVSFDGKQLLFRVSHEQAHPDSLGDPPVAFTFTLLSSQEGILESNYQGQESQIRLVKAK